METLEGTSAAGNERKSDREGRAISEDKELLRVGDAKNEEREIETDLY